MGVHRYGRAAAGTGGRTGETPRGFGDSFSGAAGSPPPSSNWFYDIGTGFGTGEIENTTNSTNNVCLDGNGHLVLKATNSGGTWSSGRIESTGATGPASADWTVSSGTSPPPSSLQISAGGPATGTWVADEDFSGGSTASTTNAISTTGVTGPAPQSVYQHNRYGNFTYTIPRYPPGDTYTIRAFRRGQRHRDPELTTAPRTKVTILPINEERE